MKYIYFIFLSIAFVLCNTSCQKSPYSNFSDNSFIQETSFFGDSTLTIISSNRTKGYQVKIFKSKDLTLLNLTRGDSINQYVPLHWLPQSLTADSDIEDLVDGFYADDSVGTYVREINIPIEKEKLGRGLFFMDVNFDGEEELLVEHPGYNRIYFACFDIVNGIANITPGILHAMDDEPYNNIVSTNYSPEMVGIIDTSFDYTKKTIHIIEQLLGPNYVETWYKLIAEDEWEKPSVKIIRREEVDYPVNGRKRIKVYERENGELILKESIEEDLNK